MDKKTLKFLEEKLKKEREKLREELSTFAREDKKPKGDWDTRYPRFDGGKLEEEADEVGEYEKLLSVEHKLELRLKDIELALDKIKSSLSAKTLNTSHLKKEKYGICEKCGKAISKERLNACPEARICRKCKKK